MYSEIVKHRLASLCRSAGISNDKEAELWTQLEQRYSEEHRFYHTLRHIASLLTMSAEAMKCDPPKLSSPDTVDWAILYHDVVYDAKSKTNEEDSADLFRALFSTSDTSSGEGKGEGEGSTLLPREMMDNVHFYIVETKAHKVGDSKDMDLKLFVDWDMSILGLESVESYREYISAVRQEYIHILDEGWVSGRTAFLDSVLSSDSKADASKSGNSDNSGIFATKEMREQYEENALRNMAWEKEQYASGDWLKSI